MKEYIKRKTPVFVKRRLRVFLEKRGLKKIETLRCDASSLLAGKISLDEAFQSEEIKNRWRDADKRIMGAFGIPNGTGGVNLGDRRALYHLISWLQPESILEIGTHVGASTVYIASALSANGNSAAKISPRLVSVDISDVNDPISKPWFKYEATHSPVEMIKGLNCGRLVSFVKNSSLEYLSNCQNKYDFIFLDGDHSAKNVYREIPAALRLLNKGGLILLHDYFPDLKPLWANGNFVSGPCLAVKRLKSEGADIEALPLGELPWPTKLNSNISSLALLIQA